MNRIIDAKQRGAFLQGATPGIESIIDTAEKLQYLGRKILIVRKDTQSGRIVQPFIRNVSDSMGAPTYRPFDRHIPTPSKRVIQINNAAYKSECHNLDGFGSVEMRIFCHHLGRAADNRPDSEFQKIRSPWSINSMIDHDMGKTQQITILESRSTAVHHEMGRELAFA